MHNSGLMHPIGQKKYSHARKKNHPTEIKPITPELQELAHEWRTVVISFHSVIVSR